MNKYLLPLTFILFLFTACKKEPVGGDLKNSHWQLSSLVKNGKIVVQPEEMGVTLSFSNEEVNGMGVCNRYFADFEAEGTTLFVDGIEATEMACGGLEFENVYFQTLSKAKNYSALASQLIIFSENGKIAFERMTDEQVKADQYENGVGKLAERFPIMKMEDTPHLYPIVRVDNPGNYPYKGTLVDTALYKHFDARTSEIWSSTGGDVLAVGKYGDFFICRVPGRYVSSDIAIFRIKNGQLHRSETVAWAWCDEGWCNQQDAWLKDFNADGRLDLVQHYTLTDDKGKVQEERVTVMVQAEDGTFKEDKSLQVDKSQFKMAKI